MKRKIKEIWEKTVGLVTALAVLAFFVLVIVACIVSIMRLVQSVRLRPADDLPPAEPAEGVAWIMPESGEAAMWLSGVCADEVETAVWLDTYTEGDSQVPAWWNPEEPMAAVWTADESCNKLATNLQPDAVDYNAHPPIGIDPGGVDWNLCTTIWGWDGHGAEAWELDLFARIFYREFWQPNLTLCEAGCDAMLGLWDLYGGTLFETLSHVNEDGSYTFSTFPGVWEAEYDPDGLAWCRAYCEERFYNGPVWPAQYFRKGHYHDWGEWSPIPAYEIDGIYFSIGKEQ
jgi:hypothetical protein